jgi:hypothetical protein
MSGEAGKSYYSETWFECLFIAGGMLVGYLLFNRLMPTVNVNAETIQTLAMAKLFAEGRWVDAFSRFNMPPIYPMLLALVIKLKHTTDLTHLVSGFQNLNLAFYLLSGGLVHYFVRRQIHKPYTFAITALYILAPPVLNMAWALNAQMTYMVLSLATLIAIDISLSKDSALGGQLSRGEIILCGTLLSLSILTWQVGYTLLLGFFFVLIKRFGLKKSASIIGVLMLCISPFIGRDLFYTIRSPQPYVEPSATLVRQVGHGGILRIIESYADSAVFTIAHHTVGDLNLNSLDTVANTPNTSGPSRIDIGQKAWGRWILAFLALTGAIYGLYQYTGIGTLYLCTYTLTALVLLPQTNLSLATVMPLLLFSLYYGVTRTGQWLKPLHISSSKIVAPVLTFWILLCSFTALLAQARGDGFGHGDPRAPLVMYMSTAQDPENRLEVAQTETAHRKAMDWLQAHTPADARIGAPKGELGSDKKGDTDVQKQLQQELGQYDYLVEEGSSKLAPLKGGTGGHTPAGLKLVYEDVAGRIRIWQVNNPENH